MLHLPTSTIDIIKVHGLTVDIFPMNKIFNGFLLSGKHIAINKNISWYEQRFAVAHELAHKICNHSCHCSWNEKEANEKAFELLISDNELLEIWEYYEWDTLMMEKEIWVSHERIKKRLLKYKIPMIFDLHI